MLASGRIRVQPVMFDTFHIISAGQTTGTVINSDNEVRMTDETVVVDIDSVSGGGVGERNPTRAITFPNETPHRH